jgi:plasmid stabilization system protein ParE
MFRIAPEALIEIGKIAEYLTVQSPSAADGFERRLDELFTTIEGSPHVGRATNRRHIRLMNTNPYPYLIFYRVRGDDISVLRVIHGARNPRSMPARPR